MNIFLHLVKSLIHDVKSTLGEVNMSLHDVNFLRCDVQIFLQYWHGNIIILQNILFCRKFIVEECCTKTCNTHCNLGLATLCYDYTMEQTLSEISVCIPNTVNHSLLNLQNRSSRE